MVTVETQPLALAVTFATAGLCQISRPQETLLTAAPNRDRGLVQFMAAQTGCHELLADRQRVDRHSWEAMFINAEKIREH